jgi:hypothetical protein
MNAEVAVSEEIIDPRYTRIEAIQQWMVHQDKTLWTDYDAMIHHINAIEVQEELGTYEEYLRDVAKKTLSKPAVSAKKIEVGKYAGRMRKAKSAYVPDEKAIRTWISRQLEATRRYLEWAHQD